MLFGSSGLFAPAAAQTGTHYVNDQVHVPMRTGPTNRHSIVRFLSTGTEVQVRATREQDREQFGDSAVQQWLRVVHNDREGWIERQYLVNEPPARTRIGEVESTLETAESRVAELESELGETESAKAALHDELEEAHTQIAELERHLEAASDGYELVQVNERLRERMRVLLDRTEALEERNRELTERGQRDWFLAGAGVLGVGLLLGLVLPRLRPRRRSWGDSL
nr:TIGR04211 family SH3 domain-containing protein [Halorhodospira abdelmalekii]